MNCTNEKYFCQKFLIKILYKHYVNGPDLHILNCIYDYMHHCDVVLVFAGPIYKYHCNGAYFMFEMRFMF